MITANTVTVNVMDETISFSRLELLFLVFITSPVDIYTVERTKRINFMIPRVTNYKLP